MNVWIFYFKFIYQSNKERYECNFLLFSRGKDFKQTFWDKTFSKISLKSKTNK